MVWATPTCACLATDGCCEHRKARFPIASRRSRRARISPGTSRGSPSGGERVKVFRACAVVLFLTCDTFALTLVKDGKSDYVIVLAKDAPPANRRAATELQTYLKQMSGAELPIVDDSKHAPPHAIYVG